MKQQFTFLLLVLVMVTGATRSRAQVFGPRTDYATSSQPKAIVSTDLNLDGKCDLISLSYGNSSSGAVWIQYGQGNGTFATGVSYAAPNLYAVEIGDVNNDNLPDIVGIGTTLTVLLGQTGGGFGAPLNTALPGEAHLLRLRDINSDGVLDVATSFLNSEAVVVLPGLGTGIFGSPVTYAVGTDVLDLEFAEVTQDGVVDLVVLSQQRANSPYPRLGIYPGLATGGFGLRTHYLLASLTSSLPTVLKLANINGDDYLDAIVVDAGTNVLSTWLGLNTGGFAYRIDYPLSTGMTVNDVAAGDVNGDGYADVLLTNSSGSNVLLLPGSSTGSLGTGVAYATGTNPSSAALVDVNADGRLDAITANAGSNNVSVLLNTSLTASTAPTISLLGYTSGVAGSTLLILGTKFANVTSVRFGGVASPYFSSLAGTQLKAVVPAGAPAGPVTVTSDNGTATSSNSFTPTSLPANSYLINNLALTTCSGTLYDSGGPTATYHYSDKFQKLLTPATAGTKMQLTFTSFDLATSFDKLYIYDGSSANSPLLGTYTGTTSPGTVTATNSSGQLTLVFDGNSSFPTAGFAATMACAGNPGFLLASSSPASNSLGAPVNTAVGLTFSGGAPTPTSVATVGVFSSQRGGRRTLGSAAVAGTTATLPVTGDAFQAGETLQVVVPATVRSASGGAAVPYTYQFTTATAPSLGKLAARSDYAAGTKPVSVCLGDVTGDGQLDLLAANQTGATVSVQPGLVGGGFGPKTEYAAGASPAGLALGDLNNDGRLDIVTTNKTANTVSVLLATASGGFATRVSYACMPGPLRVALGDLNNDGYLDMAVAYDGVLGTPSTTVLVYFNTGTGTFGSFTHGYVGPHPTDVELGDMNGDGLLDIVAANDNDLSVGVALNLGNGLFKGAKTHRVDDPTTQLALGDFNGDNILDVVVGGQTGGVVNVLTGSGQGTFTFSYPYDSYSNSSGDLRVGDLNGDGRLDIVSAANSDTYIEVLLNAPTGGFGPPVLYYGGTGSAGIALGDLNGDGRLDLAGAIATANTIGVWLNVAPPVITSFTPASGAVGTVVTITGANFSGATQLLLNGVAVPGFLLGSNATTITFTVPAGATSGLLTVITPGGSVVSTAAFTVLVPQLTVSQAGTPYASNGAAYSFGNQLVGSSSGAVSFTLTNTGTTPLALTSVVASANFLLSGPVPTTVPAGGTATVALLFAPGTGGSLSGTLTIASALGTYLVNLTGTGTYAAPVISSFTPASGTVGTVVTVTGSGFLLTGTTVTINGVVVTGVVVSNNGTTLTFAIPAGATAGPLVVTTAGGTSSSGSLCVQYTPATTSASRCGAGSLTLLATGAPAGGTYAWYTAAAGGTPIAGASGPSYTTGPLTTTATYYVAIRTGAGSGACEGARTAVTATIEAVPLQPTITQGPTGTLTSSSASGNQWYWNNVAVPGATGQSYTVNSAGQQGAYTVVVTSAAGCASLPSAAVNVVVTATKTAAANEALLLSPNPAHHTCTVQLPGIADANTGRLTLLNMLGQSVWQQAVTLPVTGARVELKLHGLTTGVYLVHLQAGSTILTKRLIVE